MVPDDQISEQFSGAIDRVQLVDVVQSACLGDTDRDISVESDFGHATVRVRSGQPVYCKADDVTGENAIKRVLFWPAGYFLSDPGPSGTPQNIWKAWEQLLIDAVQFRTGLGYTQEQDSAFSGKMTGVGLVDLVQLACMSGVERKLGIDAGNLRGAICFRGGKVIHAERGGVLGEHAFRQLMLAESGMFESRLLDGSEIDTIDKPIEELLAPFSDETADEESGSHPHEELNLAQKIQRMKVVEKIKAAMTGNHETRSVLIRENSRLVQLAVISNPRLTESEVALMAGYKHIDDEVLRRIANNREWMRLYQVRASLVKNPKCPVGISTKLVQTLGLLDLRNLAASKSIPRAVSDVAKRLIKK